jgi:hypothetical protein
MRFSDIYNTYAILQALLKLSCICSVVGLLENMWFTMYHNINFSQTGVLTRMIHYIKNFNLQPNEKSKYIDLLKIGMCNGLSFLYSIYKLAGREDVFFKCLTIILSQDENPSSLSESDKLVFESIIGQLIFVQSKGEEAEIHHFSHGNYGAFLKYLGLPFEMNFYEIFSNSREDMSMQSLTKAIENEEDEQAIRIQFGVKDVAFDLKDPGHVVIVYKKNGNYILYDPNSTKSERSFDTPQKVSKVILFNANSLFKNKKLSFTKCRYMDLNKNKRVDVPAETSVLEDRKKTVELLFFYKVKTFLKINYYSDIKNKEELIDLFISTFLHDKESQHVGNEIKEKCKDKLWEIFIEVRETAPSRMIRPHVHKAIADLVDYIMRLIYEKILRYESRDKIIKSGIDSMKLKP